MKNIVYTFWIIAVLHVFGQYTSHEQLIIYTKPILVPLLAAFYYHQGSSKIFFVALFFSWLGDVFLMGDGELFFLAGIFSFWGAQLIYLYLIYKEIKLPFKRILFSKEGIFAFALFGSYFAITMKLLGTKLTTLTLPVSGYALTLASIGALSTLLWLKNKNTKTAALLFGVSLFIVSDSMIALNEFYFKKNVFGFLVMATYIPAQFLICNYFRKIHLNSKYD